MSDSYLILRPVTRILCGGGRRGGGANEAKVDQTTEMFFLFNFFLMETSEFCNFFL